MRLLLPKTFVDTRYTKDPVFFLAGPIKGGDDWQANATTLLATQVPDCIIVNPCRYTESHPLYQYRMDAIENDDFPNQTLWERYFLDLAGRRSSNGCILFWLPCESKTNPRNDGSPYARDTYGELGEWRGRAIGNPYLNFVVGAEKDFPGLKQICTNFEDALGAHFVLHNSLEETVTAAVEKATGRKISSFPQAASINKLLEKGMI